MQTRHIIAHLMLSAGILTVLVAPAYASVPTIETNQLLLQIFPRDQYEFINRIITEGLKSAIISQLQNTLLGYLKGSAANCQFGNAIFNPNGSDQCPQFITDWQQYLFSAQSRADAQLSQEVTKSSIPEENKAIFMSLLEQPTTPYGNAFDQRVSGAEECNLQDAVDQLLCETDPKNNFEAQYFTFTDRREELQSTAKESAFAEGVASGGYTSTKRCVDEALDPRTGKSICLRWEITTPGSLTEETAAKTMNANLDQVISAFNAESLIGSVISFFVNRLIQSGVDGLLGAASAPAAGPVPSIPPPPAPITIAFTASPQTIEEGESSLITWSATNAFACSASGAWSGEKATAGSEAVSPIETSIYTIVCRNEWGGSETTSLTISVEESGEGGGGEFQQ